MKIKNYSPPYTLINTSDIKFLYDALHEHDKMFNSILDFSKISYFILEKRNQNTDINESETPFIFNTYVLTKLSDNTRTTFQSFMKNDMDELLSMLSEYKLFVVKL